MYILLLEIRKFYLLPAPKQNNIGSCNDKTNIEKFNGYLHTQTLQFLGYQSGFKDRVDSLLLCVYQLLINSVGNWVVT